MEEDGNGTSYSGGTGGGAAGNNRGNSVTAGNGNDNGGAGGAGAQGGSTQAGVSGGSTNGWGIIAGGGQGNGPGATVNSHSTYSIPIQKTGTGGLLIIYCGKLNNCGEISANGVTAQYATNIVWNGSQKRRRICFWWFVRWRIC